MNIAELPRETQMLWMAMSKMIARPIYVAAKLGVADLLRDGPRTTAELARKTRAHEPSLYRLLRMLSGVGVFAETAPRTFALTPPAELLKDEPGSLRGAVLYYNDPFCERAWNNLLYSVETGKPGFNKGHGRPMYDYLSKNRRAAKVFNGGMTSVSANMICAVAEGYDFSGIRRLVDVGGGQGALMIAILKRYPAMRGIVYDTPKVAAEATEAIARAGLASRCRAFGGDFFRSVPAADALIMSHVLHIFQDARALTLLELCRKALDVDGRLLVVESVFPDKKNTFSMASLMDLHMMVMPGGVDRTEAEYRTLFDAAGFGLSTILSLPATDISVVEGRPR